MKKFLISLLTVMLMTTANAADKEPTKEELCATVSELAESIMSLRQMGASAQELMQINGKNSLSRALVLEAFAEPAYSTEAYQEKAAREFRSKTYLECTVALDKKQKTRKKK